MGRYVWIGEDKWKLDSTTYLPYEYITIHIKLIPHQSPRATHFNSQHIHNELTPPHPSKAVSTINTIK